MTIGELREKLQQYPDFYAVAVGFPDETFSEIEDFQQSHCVVFLQVEAMPDHEGIGMLFAEDHDG